ncbi:TetR/AcrR family transcriptional regulator [Amycolatopsis saalfeldensis]|uniref:DNA-binding transcriptional regulator, AcrR family n=1 Tax=Amycolatopsis saalfeldensis TaxID=394193 RepID=A0A1H8Y5T6_9PSEU|nr:TetR/AcrR family transcriptional regulator [Amycolatopsis saalfeldensis]SEP47624.1 DNA-binding transcriptional regulator, AcrR family [Amycolatopsis saalfeldensis]
MSEEVEVSAPRTRNRWGEGDRLRGEILDAASRLLSELGGEDGLTIRGVARAVGIAPASIYQHFTDRSALVEGLLEYEFARMRAAMAAAEASEDPADAVGRVRALVHAYCQFAMDNPGHYRLMTANGATQPGPDARPRRPLLEVVDLLSAGFARCDAAGHPLRVPADRAGVIAFVGAHGRVALFHNSPRRASADTVLPFVDELVSLVFA